MTSSCGVIRGSLDAFVDGELPGALSLAVSRHLEDCQDCADEVRVRREIGEHLRTTVEQSISARDLDGLASGVISRVRAERAQSWRAVFERAIEDWHFALAGMGSLAAAVISVLSVSAIFSLAPPTRDDSLAALLNNLHTSAGTLLLMATPVGANENPMLMQFEGEGTGVGAGESDDAEALALPAGFAGPTEQDLVLALSDAIIGRDGRMSDLRLMPLSDQQRTKKLLDDLERLRTGAFAGWSGARVAVHKFGLMTNTSVSGKAL
jgi:hypothetical protein